MLRASHWLALSLFAAVVACESGRHSPTGFRLPATGNAERGKTVFLDLQCNACHDVADTNLPKPAARILSVGLGGETMRVMTDGHLVASIINPSFQIASRHVDVKTADGKSRMPDYSDRLTVRQLTDLVAFLQKHYTLRTSDPPMF
ncbi:MAG: c-type cytochrome [Acidobacteria bacterium]|nr:c-type cytochrome [Acidobacteriota bacterium]